jgi:two-component system, OmpR family, response regulator
MTSNLPHYQIENRTVDGGGRTLRLLLVEPHALLARALQMGLRYEGFAIDTVADRQAADKWLGANEYDVILVDLPGGHGLELIRRWRSGGLRTPVLVVTEPASEAERQVNSPGGGCVTLTKPFALEDLLGRLNELVQNNGKHEKNGSL